MPLDSTGKSVHPEAQTLFSMSRRPHWMEVPYKAQGCRAVACSYCEAATVGAGVGTPSSGPSLVDLQPLGSLWTPQYRVAVLPAREVGHEWDGDGGIAPGAAKTPLGARVAVLTGYT